MLAFHAKKYEYESCKCKYMQMYLEVVITLVHDLSLGEYRHRIIAFSMFVSGVERTNKTTKKKIINRRCKLGHSVPKQRRMKQTSTTRIRENGLRQGINVSIDLAIIVLMNAT